MRWGFSGEGRERKAPSLTKGTGLRPQEFDVVQLLRPLPEHDLPAGARGTVVMEYTKYPRQNDRPAYEVEFSDADGVTLVLVTLVEDDVDVVWRPVEGL